jgi:hypothetical protein
MQQQERDLIADLFGRLQQFENQPRDPEAERLIASTIARQPAAPYLLTQTVIVQEEALKQARARIAELEAKANAGSGSFLASAPKLGPWGAAPAQPQAPAPAPARPWDAPTQAPMPQPQAQAPAGGGGSFLRTALTTAAGVAGGALLFQGISSMFGHGTQAFANPMGSPSSLLPPDSFSSGDSGQDVAAAANYDSGSAYDSGSDYDPGSDDSGFDSSGDDDI